MQQRSLYLDKTDNLSYNGKTKYTPPQLLYAIIHRILSCHRIQLTPPPLTLPIQVAREFKNQDNIRWLQALMGLLSHYWARIKNLYLQYLGTKITGHIWDTYLIRNL